jgi:murein DD-endopeptidase MepM/ murein hydrolase activator NlpD
VILTAYSARHAGIDFRAALGTPVLAAADGEVRWVAERRRAGRMVVIGHGDELSTAYMHLSEIAVRAGQLVRRGEVIGRTGVTGNATTPHLHFGVCRAPAGRCGTGAGSGWDDPAGYWIEGRACFEADHPYPAGMPRLTLPLSCGGTTSTRPGPPRPPA